MRGLRRALPALLPAGIALSLLLAVWQVWMAWQLQDANRQMNSGVADAGAPAMVLFAKGRALEDRGNWEGALRAYSEAEAVGDAQMRLAVHMNGANILLRRAGVLAAKDGWNPQARTLLELAKRGYRDVLRAEPGNWSARYNLELAQILVSDRSTSDERPEGSDEQAGESNGEDELGWSDMIGALRGTH